VDLLDCMDCRWFVDNWAKLSENDQRGRCPGWPDMRTGPCPYFNEIVVKKRLFD